MRRTPRRIRNPRARRPFAAFVTALGLLGGLVLAAPRADPGRIATTWQATFNNGNGVWDNNNGANYQLKDGISTVRNKTVTASADDPCAAAAPDTEAGQPLGGDPREDPIHFVLTARFYDGDSANDRGGSQHVKSGNADDNAPMFRGDFKGLVEKLDYVKGLGFSAVWITPVVLNRSDYDYHGYHGYDFYKVDPRLESAGASYQDLINAAHAKGMKIYQDVVYDHSSRWGAKGLFTPTVHGVRDSQWSWYHDQRRDGFEYDGLVVEPSGFGTVARASGPVATTLAQPLVKHVQRLNRIRRAVPALQLGQHSTEGISGDMAFKRRYTDAVTGDVKVVGDGTLSVAAPGKGNLRVHARGVHGSSSALE